MIRGRSDSSAPHPSRNRDPYLGVVLVLFVFALVGAAGALAGNRLLDFPLLLDAGVSLGIAAGILAGVALAQVARATPTKTAEADPQPELGKAALTVADPDTSNDAPVSPEVSPEADPSKAASRARIWKLPERPDIELIGTVRITTAVTGVIAIALVLRNSPGIPLTPWTAGIAAFLCLAAAALCLTAARYLAGVDPVRLPEAPGLCRGARVIAWILVVTALSFGLAWAGMETIPRIVHFMVLAVAAAVCYELLKSRRPQEAAIPAFPLDLTVLSLLGGRTNLVASVLDSAEAQLGIDLRSTWALTVVRRSLEPLVIGLCFLAWISTSLTVVGLEEQGLIERFGVPVAGDPLQPGLHLHLPWPADQVFRIPVKRVQALAVGHEGEEGTGPENVLWAVEHAPNEYTLLLGNGRDLITVDATVQFRIRDARAWRYHSQNPADALKAIAYRAVMRNTVNRTLSEALSENVATVTGRMRNMVQVDADALGLGVEVMAFTVGGMHPPVMVASDYQGVVSAQLGKATAIVNAQVYRNQTVPQAEAAVLNGVNGARAQGAENLAKAAGQAWSFRTLESQFRASPADFYFRRRLETLEKGLARRTYTVVDTRFQRDGGELWLMP